MFSAGKRIGHISLCTLYCIPSRPVVLKVVDIDPQGSMNNCWGLLEQWSFQFKIIVNRARNANGGFQQIKQIKTAYQISATVI